MIGVGIIGAGFIGEIRARAILGTPGAQLIAASRRNKTELVDFCKRHGCRAYTDFHQLLGDDSIDAVVIATPHHQHTDIVVETARAGKAILLEKPMAPTLAECDIILEATAKYSAPLTVGFVNRFARAYESAKEIIDAGEVGKMVCGSSTMAKTWMEPNRRSWHLDRSFGGGMWLTAGIHCLDRLAWLAGSRIAQVSAQFSTSYHSQQCDDSGMVFVRFESGAYGTVTSVGYRTGAPNHLTELCCTHGALRIEYASGVSVGQNEQWINREGSGSTDWLPEAMAAQWKSFIESLETGNAPPVSAEYGRHIMASAFAAEESSRTRKEINVE